MKLLLGDCLDKLKELDTNSVDSIVTDPPYGLSFMGKKWDYDVPSQEIWEECLRVLKPGGHLLAFAGSRTYHRMAVRIEDAGFEIRDQIMWIYGSGFPKSLNIGKGIDKKFGAEREVIGTKGLNSYKTKENGQSRHKGLREDFDKVNQLTAPATDEAKEYEGWGTALKPAHEPIVMARKPLSENTVVDNVLQWGTGGINIDDSKIETNESLNYGTGIKTNDGFMLSSQSNQRPVYNGKGRFPANVIFDEEAGKILDEQSENASRFFYSPKTSKKDRNEGLDAFEEKLGGSMVGTQNGSMFTGSGNVRNNKLKNHHPTVKPTDLMLYLIRMVTPKGGTTLDPFMGSGSTGKAAIRGGFNFVGIEREKEYIEIAQARIVHESKKIQSLLFNPNLPGSVQ